MKLYSLLILVVFPVSTCFSQFQTRSSFYPKMPNLIDLSIQDLNGDGTVEILGSSEGNESIGFITVTADFEVTYEEVYNNLQDAKHLQVLDLDGDTDRDILLELSDSQTLAWLKNVGQNYILNTIAEIPDFSSFTYHDLDQDGDQDIFCVNQQNGELILIEQIASGQFSQPQVLHEIGNVGEAVFDIINLTEDSDAIFWNDLDQDGDLDLVYGGIYLAIFENIGDQLQMPILLGGGELGIIDIEPMHINNDEYLDLVCLDFPHSRIDIYYGDGGLDYSQFETISSENLILALEPFDADANGIDDLLVSLVNPDTPLAYYSVESNGNIGTITNIESVNKGRTITYLDSEDIDGDGMKELIASTNYSVYLLKHNGVDLTNLLDINGAGVREWHQWYKYIPKAVDINGDGLDDIYTNGEAFDDHIALNSGNGYLEYHTSIGEIINGSEEWFPAMGDLNNDGMIDLWRYEHQSDTYYVDFQNEDGDFDNVLEIQAGKYWEYVTAEFHDVDANGFIDLVIYDPKFEDDEVQIIYNSDGSFNQSYVLDVCCVSVRTLSFGDVNGDGLMDFLAHEDGTTSVMLNNGIWWDDMNTVGVSSGLLVENQLVDIDNDGDLDLIAKNTDNFLILLTNDQSNNWPQEIIDVNENWYVDSFEVLDLNGDSYQDLVRAGSESIEIWYNDELGGFGDPEIIDIEPSNNGLFTFDYDGDGDKDFGLVRNTNGGSFIELIENIGVQGCSDPSACNFDIYAVGVDGSCCFDNCGCTDPTALNYQPEAQCDNSSCNYQVAIKLFNDLNSDGVFNGDDHFLVDFQVHVPQLESDYLTDSNGEFFIEILDGTELFLEPESTNAFPYVSTNQNNPIDIPTDLIDGAIYVGVSASAPLAQISVELINPTLSGLCMVEESFAAIIKNEGNSNLSGTVSLNYSDLFSDLSADFDFDIIDDVGISFAFDDLAPGNQIYRYFKLVLPGVMEIGNSLSIQIDVQAASNENEETVSSDGFEFVLACAYDPNDKRVSPPGYEEPHFIAVDQELEYTVRFQNTGNSPAINVVVEDTISEYLDLSTLDIKGASHNMQVEINTAERLIRFVFPEIMLPDSTCCLEESQGFVAFAMAPLADLADGTEINNDAYIYFDNNEAIITNETWSTIMVCSDEMSAIQSDYDLQICEDTEFEFSNDSPWVEEYLWEFGGEEVSSDSIAVLLTEEPGDEVLVLTTSNPVCESTTELDFEVVENDIGGQGFYINNLENLLSLDGFETYQWLLNGDPIDGATNPTYLAPFAGDYGLYVTNSFGCGQFAEEIIAGPVSITELNVELVEVFPNPVSDVLSIEFPLDKQANYQLLDSKGSLITSGNLRKGMNTIDMSVLASGMYFLKVEGVEESIKVSKN